MAPRLARVSGNDPLGRLGPRALGLAPRPRPRSADACVDCAGSMNQAAALKAAIETLKTPASERKQEGIHLCAVLLTDHLRAMPTKLPYNLLCEACRAFVYAQLAPRVAFVDADDSGQLVLRVLLSGSVLVQRRFGMKSRSQRRAAIAS